MLPEINSSGVQVDRSNWRAPLPPFVGGDQNAIARRVGYTVGSPTSLAMARKVMQALTDQAKSDNRPNRAEGCADHA